MFADDADRVEGFTYSSLKFLFSVKNVVVSENKLLPFRVFLCSVFKHSSPSAMKFNVDMTLVPFGEAVSYLSCCSVFRGVGVLEDVVIMVSTVFVRFFSADCSDDREEATDAVVDCVSCQTTGILLVVGECDHDELS